jgi:hypothetical protein
MAQTTHLNAPLGAVAGLIASSGAEIHSRLAEAALTAGIAVCQGTLDNQVKALSAVGDLAKIQGFTIYHAGQEPLSSGTGYAAKDTLNILRKGQIWVLTEGTVAAGGNVFVRYAGTGTKGACRAAAVTDEAGQLLGAKFVTSVTGAGLAIVEINLPVTA